LSKTKSRKPDEVHKKDGLWLEWFRRRSSLDVDIYIENKDGTRGDLVSELTYPKVGSVTYADWEPEAVSIAKEELEKKKEVK
jgi:hypothetical protein